MPTLSAACQAELRALQVEGETILSAKQITRSARKRVDFILSKIATLKEFGISTSESQRAVATAQAAELGLATPDFSGSTIENSHEKLFRRFMSGASDAELRANTDFLAGQQVPVFTAGTQGGVLVPQSFAKTFYEGLAQVDEILNPEAVSVVQSDTFALPPYNVPGWDLSTIASTSVSEAAEHARDTIPGVSHNMINSWTDRLSLGASFEFETDSAFRTTMDQMSRAYAVGFARGIGQKVVLGDGVTGPSGLLKGAADSGVTLSTGFSSGVSATLNEEFQDIYFAVNAVYRSSLKCAWAMSDKTYQWIRKLSDKNGRPLVSIENDRQAVGGVRPVLMGQPIWLCPSIPFYNASLGDGKLVFGDLSRFVVRMSRPWIRRNLQCQLAVEYGLAQYIALCRYDSSVIDPTGGTNPPLVYATLSA